MQYLLTITMILASVLCLIGSAAAAPVSFVGTNMVVARGGGTYHGWATYYNAEEGRGACGWNSKNSEHVFAIGKDLWQQTSNGGSSKTCGKTATVTWRGKSVQVRVVDLCPVCGHDNIDLSPSAFEKLADKNVGKLDGISWKFD